MRRPGARAIAAGAAAATVAGLAAAPAVAGPATIDVNVQFAAFAPTPVEVLPGDTVAWHNLSERTHTVTADDGSFDSGDLGAGAAYSRTFGATGRFAFHCTLHPSMVGEIDVSPVTLQPLPPQAVPAGTAVTFAGRTGDASEPVRIVRTTAAGATTLATAAPASDGTWQARVPVQAPGDVTAVTAQGSSLPRRLLVTERRVVVHATRRGIAVTVSPPLPGAAIALELRLRERFGWWPVRRTRLDYVSEATFAIRRPFAARVALLDKDGWTALATSRVVSLRSSAGSG